MRKIIFLLALLFVGSVMFTSCSDDKNDDPIAGLEKATFTDANGLELLYSDEPMLGKTVEFISSSTSRQATLVLSSTFDFSELPGVPDALKKPFPAPGVIPGSPVITLDVVLEGNSEDASFSGTSGNEYCTFSYKGHVTKNGLSLNIDNVQLKNKAICGVWNLNERLLDDFGDVIFDPVHIVWESSAQLNLAGMELPMETLLKLLLVMPILEDGSVDCTTMLTTALKKVDFREDGNIVANYLDIVDEAEAYTDSPLNMAHYVLNGEGNMLFYLNPSAVFAAEAMNAPKRVRSGRAADIDAIMNNVLSQVIPMLSEGIQLHYRMDGDSLIVYIGGDLLLPLLKENVLPLLKDEALVGMLTELVASNPDMEGFAEMLPEIISSVVEVIEGTSNIEIGLNLSK